MEYIFRIICTVTLCVVLESFIQESATKEIIRLLSGLILTLTMLQPFADHDICKLTQFDFSYPEDAAYYSSLGAQNTTHALEQCIKQETEAYILTEVKKLGAKLEVNVSLGEGYIPSEIVIHGNTSPHVQQHLETFLESNLAIAKENQAWTE